MDEEHDSGTPDIRAPWERRIADSAYRESTAGRARTPDESRPAQPRPEKARSDKPRDSGRVDSSRQERRNDTSDGSERLTVADLVNKVERESTRGRRRRDTDNPDPPHTEPPRTATSSLPPARPREVRTDDDPTEQLAALPAAAAATAKTADPIPAPAPTPAAEPQVVGSDTASRLQLGKERRRRKTRIAGRVVVSMVSVMALIGTGSAWGFVRSTEASFSQIAALDTESDDIVDPLGQTGDETYLIVGTDSRAGASGEIGAGTEADAEGARADVAILVNIPADRSRVVAVSFPRDLDVERPACLGWDSSTGEYSSDIYPSAYGDKLNATYALGGPKCLVKVIQRMSGLKIGHFVGIDFAGFESMVDEVGGVEVCTPTPLVDGELGTILATAGNHTLNGRQALDYVRARKVETEFNGDYGRITRQQKFLSSLLRSTMSNKVLLDPGKLNGLVGAFTRATFVENVDAQSLIGLGRSLQDIDAGAVTFLTVPTAGTNDWGNEIPRLDDIKDIFTAIIDDQPLPGEKRDEPEPEPAAPEPDMPAIDEPLERTPTLVSVDPSTVSVQVSNASGVTGLAAATSEEVSALGFPIYDVGNYTGTATDTVVRFTPGNEAEAATVASSFPGAVLQRTRESSRLGNVVEVVLGVDYDGTVAFPTPAGTVLEPVRIEESTDEDSVELPADLAVTNAADDLCA